jgi:prepilin peptidase CpaA
MLSTLLLLVPLSVATVTDVRSHMIYNWTVYPGLALALVLSAVATMLGKDMVQGTASDVRWYGIVDFPSAVGGLLTCGLVMLVCYVFFPGGIGGGDVKLLAMIGAFLGTWQGLEAMLWTFVFGGCLGLITWVWQVGAVQLVRQLWRRARSMVQAGGWLPLTSDEREPLRVHLFLSPAALLAVLLVRLQLLAHF